MRSHLLLLSLVAASGLTASPAQDPSRAEDMPVVAPISGDLRVWDSAKRQVAALARPVRLAPNDRIGSPKAEPVVLQADGEFVLSVKGVPVGEKAGISLARADDRLVLRLDGGKLLVDSFERELAVDTPGGRVVGKQAYFLVEVAKDGTTRVTAVDGELTFSTPGGEIAVPAGHESSAKGGAAPAPARPTTIAEPAAEFAPKTGGPNLVQNPGFENDLKQGWDHAVRHPEVCAADDRVSHSGRRSLRTLITPSTVTRESPPKTTTIWIDQDVKLVPDRRYLVRVYLKLDVRKGTVRPTLGVDGVKANNPQLASMYWQEVKPSAGWTMARSVVTATDEKGTVEFRVAIDDADFDATLWVDDWSLVPLPDPGR